MHRAQYRQVAARPQPGNELEHLLLCSHVERCRGLVQEHERGLLGDRPRENRSLPLATAERTEATIGQVRSVEAAERRPAGADVPGAGEPR